jgi:hypothetical protein
MTDHPPEIAELNVREQIVRIDHLIVDMQRINADRDRKRQEIRYAPWLAVMGGMTTGAALFAAGAAFVKILG